MTATCLPNRQFRSEKRETTKVRELALAIRRAPDARADHWAAAIRQRHSKGPWPKTPHSICEQQGGRRSQPLSLADQYFFFLCAAFLYPKTKKCNAGHRQPIAELISQKGPGQRSQARHAQGGTVAQTSRPAEFCQAGGNRQGFGYPLVEYPP
jgi:hypothetical protein